MAQLRRHAALEQPARAALEACHDDGAATSVAILIPSYREEPRVILQTVLSAALAEYPARRVALLLDDPPHGAPAQMQALRDARDMIADLDARFAAQVSRMSAAPAADPAVEVARLALLYDGAADFVAALGAQFRRTSSAAFAHADAVFLREVIEALESRHRARAARLRGDPAPAAGMLAHERRRLASLFDCPIASFERKRFANLSHEPNKAMNLNAYIGLLGQAWRIAPAEAGRPGLHACAAAEADLVVPDAEYVLTLDADSIICRSLYLI